MSQENWDKFATLFVLVTVQRLLLQASRPHQFHGDHLGEGVDHVLELSH